MWRVFLWARLMSVLKESFSLEGRRCRVFVNHFLPCAFACAGPLLPGSKASTIIMVVFSTSHSSSELLLSAASLEGGGCTILRSWIKIFLSGTRLF